MAEPAKPEAYVLRPYPSYGDNKIADMIVFESNKRDPDFGSAYVYMKEHAERDRNRFIWKLRDDLRTDSKHYVTSRSQTSYSTLSYNSVFEEYYEPMPCGFEKVNDAQVVAPEKVVAKGPPQNYGYSTYNPPFENQAIKIKAAAANLRYANKVMERRDLVMSIERKSGKYQF
ncbi:hypothetical protein B484DRAFT_444319 [Ochromonadaceae sp. CCMP2298]|nr:hypothetical protein B484DRAFT_444319 [Ochromonadaceae sp. CCMP2298]|mmetsp:Transcript_3922/g.8845  ORF Transcript_3922/g.8845 Transcript_3922/m.8845 type:complete len:172 (-) Transcript_3922:165-680(-)|eukprot:CAMPEP_0173197764 /NCGR_PEP_ID=MMETSP1141-20130122/16335_1 /TAXON_ID=483371 /ORGANISM="non described non described, Strain CCMP2298" /LENGTH=171 /DNA_ID=CAMNT_0014122527 /DNA_START=118 /DNA_END=633 /DNA_ORIENTATION=-